MPPEQHSPSRRHPWRWMGAFLVGAAIAGGIVSYAAQQGGERHLPAQPPSGLRGKVMTDVDSITSWKQNAAPMAWNGKTDRVYFNRRGSDDMFDAYSARPDGSDEQCISCNIASFARIRTASQRGVGDVTPDGKYAIMTIESPRNGGTLGSFAEPGKGVNNDLWLAKTDGSQAWRLTDSARMGVIGVIWPRFDRSGTKLVWAEDYKSISPKHVLGSWRLKYADLSWRNGQPKLEHVQSYEDKEGFYEPYGFSPDSKKILFASDTRMPAVWDSQIYTVKTDGTDLKRLSPADAPTGFYTNYNEFAEYTPDGKHIIYGRTKGADKHGIDYWMMNPDGTDQQRLTFMNEPWNSQYRGYTVAGGFAFNPHDPNQVVAGVSPDIDSNTINALMITLAQGGLKGEYFAKPDLSDMQAVHYENPSAGMKWDAAPAPGVPRQRFSARWTGKLAIREAGEYKFCAYIDDGARLNIDDYKVIDAWRIWPGKRCGDIALRVGKHAVKLEYHNDWGTGALQLLWQTPGLSRPSQIPTPSLTP